jgi:hypothetical protein
VKSRFHTLMLGSLDRSTCTIICQSTLSSVCFKSASNMPHLSVSLIYTRQIDFADECHLGR